MPGASRFSMKGYLSPIIVRCPTLTAISLFLRIRMQKEYNASTVTDDARASEMWEA